MKEYVLIRRTHYEALIKNSGQDKSKLPIEVENNLNEKYLMEEAPESKKKSIQLEDKKIIQPLKRDVLPHNEQDVVKTRIIPLYVNTVPKQYRDIANEIAEDLISRGKIQVNSDGYVSKPGIENMFITFEELLRALMIKNASVSVNAVLLREIAREIDPEKIRNEKILKLIGHGKTSPVTDWIR